MAAIRYFFLKVEKIKDITFKPEESLSFDGNTGPYLLYTYARARSILKKANYKKSTKLKVESLNEKETQLITALSNFPQIVQQAHQKFAPNLIANYSYDLAQKFNEFYQSTKVIGTQEESQRLALVDAFSQTLKNALCLLGIQTLEKM